MFGCVVSLRIFPRCLYFDSPYGLEKIRHNSLKYSVILHNKTYNKIYIHVASVQDSFLFIPLKVVLCQRLLLLVFLFSAMLFLELPIQYHQTVKKMPNSPSPSSSKTSNNNSKPNTKLRQVFTA